MEIKGIGLGYEGIGNVASTPAPKTEPAEAPEAAAEAVSVKEQQDQTKVDTQGKGEQSGDSEKKEATDDQIKQAIDEINKRAKNSEAIFGIHEKTNRMTIKIVDKDTKEVIKELPAEKTLDLIAKAWEMAGLLVDEKR